jgi:hypothetical protein
VAGVPGAGVPLGVVVEVGGGWGPDVGFEVAEPPGCSRAIVTPKNAATPVLISTASRVRRPMWTCVRARTTGDNGGWLSLTALSGRASIGTRVSRRGPWLDPKVTAST